MPTVYERIKLFCEINNKPLPHYNDKARIGAKINLLYLQSPDKHPLEYVNSVEDSGTYRVLRYPESFVTIIDKTINDFLLPKQKRIRQRKRVPAFSGKPSNKN